MIVGWSPVGSVDCSFVVYLVDRCSSDCIDCCNYHCSIVVDFGCEEHIDSNHWLIGCVAVAPAGPNDFVDFVGNSNFADNSDFDNSNFAGNSNFVDNFDFGFWAGSSVDSNFDCPDLGRSSNCSDCKIDR